MTINFENESRCSLELPLEELAEKVIMAALDYVNCPYETEINLLITDEEQIHEMNRDFRQIDRATDVLSFPMLDYETPGDFSFLDDETSYADCFNPETGELLMGDIVISAPRVVEQAREYGHSVKREYSFLIAHSMLHLSGFDHMEPDEAVQMERMQKEILDSLEIYRS